MDKREASGVLAQCKWLKDQIKRWEAAAKEVVDSELEAGEKAAAVAPDGSQLGYVTKAKGKRAMQINNEDGFLAWVKMRYPTEVVEAVRPAFIKKCQETMLEKGALIDGNGEVCEHVSMHQGEEYTFVKLDQFADALITQAILRRKLMDVITPPSELPPGVVVGDAATAGGAHESEVYSGGTTDNTAKILADYCAATEAIYPEPSELPPVEEADELGETYTGPLATAGLMDLEPDLSDYQVGPPHWQDSNTFESDPNVRRLRGDDAVM